MVGDDERQRLVEVGRREVDPAGATVVTTTPRHDEVDAPGVEHVREAARATTGASSSATPSSRGQRVGHLDVEAHQLAAGVEVAVGRLVGDEADAQPPARSQRRSSSDRRRGRRELGGGSSRSTVAPLRPADGAGPCRRPARSPS